MLIPVKIKYSSVVRLSFISNETRVKLTFQPDVTSLFVGWFWHKNLPSLWPPQTRLMFALKGSFGFDLIIPSLTVIPFSCSEKNLRTVWQQRLPLNRGSTIGFPGSGIWLIWRPGFGILKENGDEIRDCNYDRDTEFGDFKKRESGNVALKKPRFGNFRGWNLQRKSSSSLLRSEIAEQWPSRHRRFPRPYHTALWRLWWSVVYFREPWPKWESNSTMSLWIQVFIERIKFL